MKKFIFPLLCLMLASPGLFSQNGLPTIAGARGAAMGNTGVTFTDINSSFTNQAGLAYLENFSATVNGERRFLLSEIQSFSMGMALPTTSGTFGLTANYYGFEVYNEQKIGVSYSRKLFEQFAIGAQFDLLNTQIEGYENKAVITFEAGFLAELSEELTIGGHVYSPARLKLTIDENIPTIFSLGVAYNPSSKVFVTVEAEKDIEYPTRVKAGVEYWIISPLAVRVGVASNPSIASFGLGFEFANGLSIDIGSYYHQLLGITPAFGISYRASKKPFQNEDIDNFSDSF